MASCSESEKCSQAHYLADTAKSARPRSWRRVGLIILLVIVTAPYRRTFKLYTWRPLKEMRAARGNRSVLIPLVRQWKAEKYEELRSVQVSASFCAGAAIAGTPWSKASDDLWVANALFVSSLLCAIWAIISTIQTKSILDDLPDKEDLNATLADIEVTRVQRTILRYKRSPALQHWIMVFIWQFPSMTMAYSWVTFLSALTVHICDPFIRRLPWQDEHKTAIVYLVIGLLGLATYIFTAVFVYMSEKDLEHYVTGATKRGDLETGNSVLASALPPTLPAFARSSGSSKGSTSYEQFCKDGFVKIDLEQQTGAEPKTLSDESEPKNRKKTRLILFN